MTDTRRRYDVIEDGTVTTSWRHAGPALKFARVRYRRPEVTVVEVIDTAIPDRVLLLRKDSALVG